MLVHQRVFQVHGSNQIETPWNPYRNCWACPELQGDSKQFRPQSLSMSDVYILIWHQEKGRKTMVSHKSVWRSRSFVLLPLLKCWYLDPMDKVWYIYIYKFTK